MVETLEAKAAETKYYVSQSNMALVDEVLKDMNLKESLKENLRCFTAGKKRVFTSTGTNNLAISELAISSFLKYIKVKCLKL